MESPLLNRVAKEARGILDESSWCWDAGALGFRRLARATESESAYDQRRRMQPCPDLISFQDLEEHGLYSEPQDPPVDPHTRAAGLKWLRSRIESAEPNS
jgi:hypothetical protein